MSTTPLPPPGLTNRGPFIHRPRHGDDHFSSTHGYEVPREDPDWPDVYCYTDEISYAPGDLVRFHASTTAETWDLIIEREGATLVFVHSETNIHGHFTALRPRSYAIGCDWPVATTWRIPQNSKSGFYRVTSSCRRRDGSLYVQHHFFVVRPPLIGQVDSDFLLLLPTCTWTAYNDFGGANYYLGIDGDDANSFSPTLSVERPWTRGIVWLPEAAPRVAVPRTQAGFDPAYTLKDWAFANGFGQSYAAAGWAQYDRHFVRWAERKGWQMDMITQTDLELRPELLKKYRTLVVVGHDEYWSRGMRDAVDAFVDSGGSFARFGANFVWQIRLEAGSKRQVCYKYRARSEDPFSGTDQEHLLTSAWEDVRVNHPGATTVGVNGLRGIYAAWGGFAQRGTRGFTIYLPDHWSLAGTGYGYGDVLGEDVGAFGYEVDGIEYVIRNGLPVPTGEDGAPKEIQIIAMSPAVCAEHDAEGTEMRQYVGDSDLRFKLEVVTPDGAQQDIERHRYGAGMIVEYRRGNGLVFTAASCEWVNGLRDDTSDVSRITDNVLRRMCACR